MRNAKYTLTVSEVAERIGISKQRCDVIERAAVIKLYSGLIKEKVDPIIAFEGLVSYLGISEEDLFKILPFHLQSQLKNMLR